MERIKNLIELLANARIVHAMFKEAVEELYMDMTLTIEGQEWLYTKSAAATASNIKAEAEAAVREESLVVYTQTGDKKFPYGVQVKEFKQVRFEFDEEIDLREWAFENMRGLLVLDEAKVKAAAEAGLLEGIVEVIRYLEPKVTIPKELKTE